MNVFLCIAALLSVSPAAVAQEPYSADSLMATFKNSAQSPIKGSEIRFSDVVTEIRKSSVVFKSSSKDRVICELTSPMDHWKDRPAIGSSLTVVGRVRGRGMLGNVTLDQCALALPPVVTNEPPPSETFLPAFGEPVEQDEAPPSQLPEVTSVDEPAPVSVAERPKNNSTPGSMKPATPVAGVAPANLVADKQEQSSQTVERTEQAQTISDCTVVASVSFPYGSHLVSLFAGIVAVLAFGKLRRITANRSRIYTSGARTEEVRRAALEALLSRQKK